MKKALSFVVALGLVVGLSLGCSLSQKDQQNLRDAIIVFSCVDGVIVDKDSEDQYTIEDAIILYTCVDGVLIKRVSEEAK